MTFLLILFLWLAASPTGPSAATQNPEYLCPTFEIICPDAESRRNEITFSVRFTSGDRPSSKTTYTWRVSGGKITNGQGTPTIKVVVSKRQKNKVTATLNVGGFPPECPLVASCATQLKKP